MAGKIKFYRGAQGTSLPQAHQNGAIFIIERANSSDGVYTLGDIYVDMDNATRLHIAPDSDIIIYDSTMSGTVSSFGKVYFFQETNKKGIAVGDGAAYIGDLPVYNFNTMKTAIQSKVNAYLGTEYLNLDSDQLNKENLSTGIGNSELAAETLVLSREL